MKQARGGVIENTVGLPSSKIHCQSKLEARKGGGGCSSSSKQPIVKDVMKVISKSWLVGFTEAEGSFYLVVKGTERLAFVRWLH